MKTINFNKTARIAFISAIILTVGSLFVQANTVIKGRILDENNQPIPYATATIIDPETNQIVEGDMTDENGRFFIENIKPGKYILSLRTVGFETNETKTVVVKKVDETVNAGKLYMNEAVIVLNELYVLPASATAKSTSQLN